MNYDNMTDKEVNKKIAVIMISKKYGGDLVSCDFTEDDGPDPGFDLWIDDGGLAMTPNCPYNTLFALPDYCNNPSDAWSIIAKHQISVINISGTTQWFACCNVTFENICMLADGSDNGISSMDAKHSAYNTNPLKAAMCCFLMMQEKSNA